MKQILKRRGVLFATVIICFLLQNIWAKYFSLANITPNILIIVTASIGFMRGNREGMFVGFFAGLLIDVFYGDLIGFYALVYMIIGYINGYFQRMFYDEDIKLPIILIGISDFVYGIVVYFFMYMLRSRLEMGFFLGHVIIPELVYTILVTLFLYQIIRVINRKLESTEKRSASKFV